MLSVAHVQVVEKHLPGRWWNVRMMRPSRNLLGYRGSRLGSIMIFSSSATSGAKNLDDKTQQNSLQQTAPFQPHQGPRIQSRPTEGGDQEPTLECWTCNPLMMRWTTSKVWFMKGAEQNLSLLLWELVALMNQNGWLADWFKFGGKAPTLITNCLKQKLTNFRWDVWYTESIFVI